MAQNYKYFISGVNAANDIEKLRKMFPEHYFMDGKHKDKSGVYVLTDTKNKEYGERKQSCLKKRFVTQKLLKEDQEIVFWTPACSTDEFNVDSYFINRTPIPYVKIELKNGKKLKINPAAGEPRQLIFGEEPVEETIPFAVLFSRATEYGRLGYSLIYKEEEMKDKGGILTNDPDVLRFVELAITNSYKLPQDVWNWLGWISFNDIVKIYQAGMGADERFLAFVQEQ